MVLSGLMQRLVHRAFRAEEKELPARPPMRETASDAAQRCHGKEGEEKEDHLTVHHGVQSVKCHPWELS